MVLTEDPVAVFEALFADNYSDIAAYCQRRLPADTANEATSETFFLAWERLDDVPPGEQARLWLFGVARRKVEHQRRQAKSRLRLQERIGLERPTRPPGVDHGEDLAEVLAAAATLSELDLELLRLVAWEGLSHGEVAEVVELSTNAVGIRIHRIRKKLRSQMKGQQEVADVRDQTATVTDTEEGTQ